MLRESIDQETISVLIADDHPLLRDGVGAVLSGQADMALVGEASNGFEAIAQYRKLRPSVVLMDLQMPGMSGVEAVASLLNEFPHARIIMLTTYKGDIPARVVLRAGVRGYILKSMVRTKLLEAIRHVFSGGHYVPTEIRDEIARHDGLDPLTDREILIMRGVSKGLTNKDIAAVIGLSAETVKQSLKTIFLKLGVSDRTEAAMIVERRGFLSI